jgi:DNA repair protein SbcD/Mre11
MKVLHTSDWHLGRTLYGRKRYDEFDAFLAWLAETIDREAVDVLLVAGDVFDTSTPSNRAQGLYYRFLCRVAASACRHVVVTAGNHDSPSFLNAPRELLRALDVHVVGAVTEKLEDEVLVLNDPQGTPELIVCAVPYLRDRDIRLAEACESIEDKDRKLIEGIRSHYCGVVDLAERKRREQAERIPVIAVGHLFVAGGRTVEGDGVRELYVGSLAHVPERIFPSGIDYLCLGHLHVPQKINGCEVRRYCGAPLPMGFGEAGRSKCVCMVEFTGSGISVETIEVPVFQELVRIEGAWQEIADRMAALCEAKSQAWLEVVYDGREVIGDLRERLEAAVAGSGMEILRVRNNRIIEGVLNRIDDESLDDLDVYEVFERCLSLHAVSDEQRAELQQTYREAVASIHEEDARAE